MAVIHRALFTWFTTLAFLIFLVLKLDAKINWNWFLIVTPLWVFDLVVLVYLVINFIIHCKNGYDRNHSDWSVQGKIWFLAALAMKILFELLLCVRLEGMVLISFYFIMIPFWVLATVASVDLFRGLVAVHRRPL